VDSASAEFVLFGLAAALVSNFSRVSIWRSIVLMLASIVFLGLLAHSPIALVPVAGFLLLGYIGLLLIDHGWPTSAVWSIPAVIFFYVWLKKYTFLPEKTFLHYPYFTLGLSYIFFRVLHLLIEARDGSKTHRPGFGAYLLYTLNFTTFISGPIQRYDAFARDQFASEPIPLGACVIGLQLERIVRGFFKVNVLAMLLHIVHESALAQMAQPLPLLPKLYAAFRLAIVYPFYLYANFSGYIDIMIALARLMRVRLPENFDRPFSASSVLDFWNQWHMTLSNWLKTYVYNPLLLALMRRISSPVLEPFLGVFCFFVTFFLIGLWHGRTSEFVVFGALTGAGMSINKLWQVLLSRSMGSKRYREVGRNTMYAALGRGLNFSWFAFTLFWFWGDWKQIGSAFSALSTVLWIGTWLMVWLAGTVALGIWEWLRAAVLSFRVAGEPILLSRYARVVYTSALGLASLVITVLLNQPAPEIVYKGF
jgi:alginate O-acetyltransferase complex protein AlgI